MSRNYSFQDRNIVWYILLILIFIPLLSRLIFSENLNHQSLLSGLAAIVFSTLIAYFLIFKGTPLKKGHTPRYSLENKEKIFSPTVLSPSKLKKDTVLRGKCNHCQENTIFGFTCSYCGLYFCSDHRLPEKHNCLFLAK